MTNDINENLDRHNAHDRIISEDIIKKYVESDLPYSEVRAGVDFSVRRGDIFIVKNPITHRSYLAVKREAMMDAKGKTPFLRKDKE